MPCMRGCSPYRGAVSSLAREIFARSRQSGINLKSLLSMVPDCLAIEVFWVSQPLLSKEKKEIFPKKILIYSVNPLQPGLKAFITCKSTSQLEGTAGGSTYSPWTCPIFDEKAGFTLLILAVLISSVVFIAPKSFLVATVCLHFNGSIPKFLLCRVFSSFTTQTAVVLGPPTAARLRLALPCEIAVVLPKPRGRGRLAQFRSWRFLTFALFNTPCATFLLAVGGERVLFGGCLIISWIGRWTRIVVAFGLVAPRAGNGISVDADGTVGVRHAGQYSRHQQDWSAHCDSTYARRRYDEVQLMDENPKFQLRRALERSDVYCSVCSG